MKIMLLLKEGKIRANPPLLLLLLLLLLLQGTKPWYDGGGRYLTSSPWFYLRFDRPLYLLPHL